jgi:hypothetical protein
MISVTRCLALILFTAAIGSAVEPAKVAGKWNAALQLEAINSTPTLNFKQDGEKLTGTYEGYYGASPLEGQVKENEIGFVVTMTIEGSRIQGVFSGTVEGDTMGGSVEFEGAGSGKWSAARAK